MFAAQFYPFPFKIAMGVVIISFKGLKPMRVYTLIERKTRNIK